MGQITLTWPRCRFGLSSDRVVFVSTARCYVDILVNNAANATMVRGPFWTEPPAAADLLTVTTSPLSTLRR